MSQGRLILTALLVTLISLGSAHVRAESPPEGSVPPAPEPAPTASPTPSATPVPTKAVGGAQPDEMLQAIDEALQLRDPFKSPERAIIASTPLTELERYPLEQYKLIGVITGANRLRAILLDPSGKTHFVAEKMRIGTRRGVIREIRSDVVIVREKIFNVLGKEEASDAEIKLLEEKASVPDSSG